jgi:hypothetical protein
MGRKLRKAKAAPQGAGDERDRQHIPAGGLWIGGRLRQDRALKHGFSISEQAFGAKASGSVIGGLTDKLIST